MDKIQTIIEQRKVHRTPSHLRSIDVMADEVERLRKIEDAALRLMAYWAVVGEDGRQNTDHGAIDYFEDMVRNNPRPKDSV